MRNPGLSFRAHISPLSHSASPPPSHYHTFSKGVLLSKMDPLPSAYLPSAYCGLPSATNMNNPAQFFFNFDTITPNPQIALKAATEWHNNNNNSCEASLLNSAQAMSSPVNNSALFKSHFPYTPLLTGGGGGGAMSSFKNQNIFNFTNVISGKDEH